MPASKAAGALVDARLGDLTGTVRQAFAVLADGINPDQIMGFGLLSAADGSNITAAMLTRDDHEELVARHRGYGHDFHGIFELERYLRWAAEHWPRTSRDLASTADASLGQHWGEIAALQTQASPRDRGYWPSIQFEAGVIAIGLALEDGWFDAYPEAVRVFAVQEDSVDPETQERWLGSLNQQHWEQIQLFVQHESWRGPRPAARRPQLEQTPLKWSAEPAIAALVEPYVAALSQAARGAFAALTDGLDAEQIIGFALFSDVDAADITAAINTRADLAANLKHYSQPESAEGLPPEFSWERYLRWAPGEWSTNTENDDAAAQPMRAVWDDIAGLREETKQADPTTWPRLQFEAACFALRRLIDDGWFDDYSAAVRAFAVMGGDEDLQTRATWLGSLNPDRWDEVCEYVITES